MKRNYNDYVDGYKKGVIDGKREALIELQKTNQNSDLPSNETLYKIFRLLFKCIELDEKTCSIYMNSYEHYSNYITKNWNENNTK